MVLSIIDNSIQYPESKNIDPDDIDHEAYVYYGEILNNPVNFVLGKPKFDYVENNIIYFYIYLVNNENIHSKIGLYEVNDNDYNSLIDSDGNISEFYLETPLLFNFANNIILKDYKLNQDTFANADDIDFDTITDSDNDTDTDSDSEIIDEPIDQPVDVDESLDDTKDNPSIVKPLLEQSKEESDKEYQQYQFNDQHTWVSQFLHTNKYTIHDNEGGGDCFYAVLRDALLTRNKSITIKEIRNSLANEADETLFLEYRNMYQSIYKSYKEYLEIKKQSKNEFDSIKLQLSSQHLLIADKAKLLDKAQKAKSKFTETSHLIIDTKDTLEELDFMNGVNTLDDFKNIIKSNQFWANVWAISCLERIYNVKFIILSKKHYDSKDYDNILQCGEIDKVLAEKNLFQPEFYILCDYIQGVHYKLIKYMDRATLSFKELPFRVKQLVCDKCLERLAGPFSIIPEFIEFKNKNYGVDKPDLKDIKNDSVKSLPDKFKQLYNENLVYVIHSRAADLHPGKGNNEIINRDKLSKQELGNLIELKTIKDWRKQLDNNVGLIEIDGKNYDSINNYLSVKKIKRQDVTDELMMKLLTAKFKNPELLKTLLLTYPSKLVQYTPKVGLSDNNILMNIRNQSIN